MSFPGRKLPPPGRWLLLFAAALLFILLLSALFLVNKPDSRATGEMETGMEELERRLEIKRHKQLAAIKILPANTLSQFTTDGCSGGLSVGWEYMAGKISDIQTSLGKRPPWESCCISHDRKYHTGGPRQTTPEKSFQARRKADLALRSCVLKTGHDKAPELSKEYDIPTGKIEIIYTGIANLMYRAVRIGGMPCTGLPWRWGYGWPECN